MQKRIFITLLLCAISLTTAAQNTDSQAEEGSVYSQFGVGYPLDLGSSSADGIGLLGVSYIEPRVPSIANPAHWGSTVFGMATGGIRVDNFNAEDNLGSAQNSLVGVNQFQLQLPVYKNKLGVSASFSPYSRTAFQLFEAETQTAGSGSNQQTINVQTETTGSGGVNRFELGLGWKINDQFSVGYAASLMFVSIDEQFQTALDEDINLTNPNTLLPVDFTLQTSGSGFGNRLGIYFTQSSVAKEKDQLSIGATLNLPVQINGERVQEQVFGTDDSDDNIEDDDRQLRTGDIQLPLGVSGGITYKPSNKLAFTSEGLYQKWSNYENELNTAAGDVFTDRFKVGVGANYFPFVTGSDKFLSNFKYRLGASYDSGHLEINGENINTIKFSAGIGILPPRANSSVDINFEFGIRGTKSQNLVKESIWGVSLSLNLAEIFFFRPKLQ